MWMSSFGLMQGCTGRHFFVDGNSGIVGRIYAYCPVKQIVTRVSKSDVVAASAEAHAFVRGFLAGSEPGPPVDHDGMMIDDDSRVAAWRAATLQWRRSGR